MRFVRLFAISGLIMFLLLTGIGLLFPSTVLVSRTTTINQRADSVQMLLADVKKWKLWLKDANEQTVLFKTPQTAGKGTVASIGKSEVKMLESSDSLVLTVWNDGESSQQTSYMRMIAHNQQTILNWSFEQRLAWYPWERFSSMMNDKILGPLMEESLARVKQLAENGSLKN